MEKNSKRDKYNIKNFKRKFKQLNNYLLKQKFMICNKI